jgi:hypothetical protein
MEQWFVKFDHDLAKELIHAQQSLRKHKQTHNLMIFIILIEKHHDRMLIISHNFIGR